MAEISRTLSLDAPPHAVRSIASIANAAPVLNSGKVCVIDAFHPIAITDPVPTAFLREQVADLRTKGNSTQECVQINVGARTCLCKLLDAERRGLTESIDADDEFC